MHDSSKLLFMLSIKLGVAKARRYRVRHCAATILARSRSILQAGRLVIKSDTHRTKVGILEARGVLKPPKPPTGSAPAHYTH